MASSRSVPELEEAVHSMYWAPIESYLIERRNASLVRLRSCKAEELAGLQAEIRLLDGLISLPERKPNGNPNKR